MAWLTANALLRQGRSWSGNERNRGFLNIGGGRPMANISAVSGLDFLDDARGVAATDWDQDGDLDFWISNRTAPLVRFVRNGTNADNREENASISFRLQGVQCNRDAIGARLELTVNRGQPEKRIQTLAAGDAFLAQSSKWMHFGLGKMDGLKVESLDVRWPDGSRESFGNIEPNHRYRIVQGSGKVEPLVTEDRQLKLQPSAPAPQWSSAARVPMFSRLPLPKQSVNLFNGKKLGLGGPGEHALLINLWASWCAPCLGELKDFAEHANDLETKGVRIVALSIDRLDGQSGEAAARKIAGSFGGKISFAWADEGTMDTLETVQRTLIQGNRPLPVPSSFLLGRDGRLQVLYLGPVTATQLLQDTDIESISDLAKRTEVASPFAGRRRGSPKPIEPMQIALKFFEGGYRPKAKDYLRQLIQIGETREPGYQDLKPGPLYYFLGALSEEDGDIAGAITAFERTVNYDPKNVNAYRNLVKLTAKTGQLEKSVSHLEALEELAPTAATPLRMDLAQKLYKAGRHREAADNMRAVLRLNPGQLTAASNLAWILATNPRADVRNGAEALKWAAILVKNTEQKDPRALDTLAAAYAETGDFENAVKASHAAIAVATKLNQQAFLPELRSRLASFQQGKPWRQ
jgi:tetratricopeptide (TPR) repeat protein/peroxiredoxin